MATFWFIVDVVFWVGFFVLEGFDFGVGALHSFLGRSDREQRVIVNTIGPFWDGNEVWLIVAAAVIFAAFPQWYATMFSSLYLAMLLLLVALICRGVSFEYRSKVPGRRWAATWRWTLTIGSALVPLLFGIAFGDLLGGLPINKSHEFTGSFVTLLQPYALWTGCTMLGLSLLSGATFIAIRTTGNLADRAAAASRRFGWVAVILVVGLVIWTHHVVAEGDVPTAIDLTAVLAVLAAAWAASQRSHGWAFSAASVAVASVVMLLFINLYPHVMISSTNPAYSLTVAGTASPPYSLRVMTIVAVIFTPFVLIYQAWNFWVFRRRLAGPTSERATAPSAPGSST